MKCPKCGTELTARVIFDKFDGGLNLKVCPGCSLYCEPIPQPTLMEVYAQREQFRATMDRASC
jgi:transcription elongation factor Elf1